MLFKRRFLYLSSFAYAKWKSTNFLENELIHWIETHKFDEDPELCIRMKVHQYPVFVEIFQKRKRTYSPDHGYNTNFDTEIQIHWNLLKFWWNLGRFHSARAEFRLSPMWLKPPNKKRNKSTRLKWANTIMSREAGHNSCCYRRPFIVLTLLNGATSKLRPLLRSKRSQFSPQSPFFFELHI